MSEYALSVVIPVGDEAENLPTLLPSLGEVLDDLHVPYEVLLVMDSLDPGASLPDHVRMIQHAGRGYGSALIAGIEAASGQYILTMEAHLSYLPTFIKPMWERRTDAEVIIASRYAAGGKTFMPLSRYVLSRLLNLVFSRGLSLRVRDMSSGFRMYHADVVQRLKLQAHDFSILQEILVKTYCEGWRVLEIPLTYSSTWRGNAWSRVVAFGRAYWRTFVSLYRLRNSILSADYDDRAYDSVVVPQRYWQRQRYQMVTTLVEGRTLDVGCGSSRIISALPEGSVALDILLRKLRYARKFGVSLVHGSGFDLPFGTHRFSCVLCSQVIEHVPKDSSMLGELDRVLAPGGLLVLGTPDYANWQWNVIEAIYERVLPSAYADEHISHYTRKELVDIFAHKGYQVIDTKYILQGELILALRKP